MLNSAMKTSFCHEKSRTESEKAIRIYDSVDSESLHIWYQYKSKEN